MTGRSRISRAGLELIKSFEGFREQAVRLADGRWIVGYGHVRTAREGVTISETDAENLLRYDLKAAEEAISTLVFSPLDQNQYDALVSLVFNISPDKFRDSEILRALNAGDNLGAANGFDPWRKARINGRVMVVDALVRRRAAEKALFLEPLAGRTPAPTNIVSPELDRQNGAPADMPVIAALTPKADASAAADIPADQDEPLSPTLPDIAAAIRHIAEQVGGATAAVHEVATDAEPAALEADFTPAVVDIAETGEQPQADEPAEPANAEAHVAPHGGSETLEEARRAMAERVARILQRAEKTIADAEAVMNREEARTTDAAPPVAPAATPQPAASPEERLRAIFGGAPAQSAPQPAEAKPAARQPERPIPEDLPDFDAELRSTGVPKNGRRFIDDTETFEPSRDPADIFAEAVRNEQIVNGRARRFGPIAGRAVLAAPWIAMFVLSLIGLAIALVESLRGAAAEAASGGSGGSSAMLAVFGVLMVMSVYFIVTRPLNRS